MRLSTQYQTQRSIDSISERYAALQRTQDSIASGSRIQSPSDDPQAAANAERVRAQLARIEVDRRTIGFAKTILGQADGALSDAGDALQASREQVLAAGNGAYDSSDRAAIATQLISLRGQLLASANRADGSGGFLFGGQGSSSAPFIDNGQVSFSAQAGTSQVDAELSLTTSLDGRATFTEIAPADASGSNENIFDRLQTVIAVLRDPNSTASALQAALKTTTDALDRAIDSSSLRRTEVGEQLRRIDAHESALSSTEAHSQTYLSGLIDVNLAQAISQMSALQTNQDAAMKTYQRLSTMSLFNYL